MTVRLSWLNRTPVCDEQRVYRDTSAFDATSLPTALATIAAGANSYDDATAATGTRYWYAVGAVVTGSPDQVALSAVVEITTAASIDALLMESGDTLLLESGDRILLE